MEDKELQELFEAKRTVEANRHRQEELAAMIGHQARRSRPMWPVWVGAAAASVALLIVALPMATSHKEGSPVQIAAVEPSDLVMQVQQDPATADSRPITTKATAQRAATPLPSTTVQEIAAPQPQEQPSETDVPVIATEQKEEEMLAPAPRVMRRTSTMLACTDGCPEPEGAQEPSKRNIHIEFFGSQQLAEATQYTITFNK